MTAENFDRTLAAFQRRTPYQPFTVVLLNGDRFEVDHPGAMVYRDGVALYAGPGGVPHVFDHEGVAQFIGDLTNQPAAQE